MGTTRNYSWNYPVPGADADTWGTILNQAFRDADTTVKTVDDRVTALEGGTPTTSPVLLAHGNVTLAATFLVLDLSTYVGYKRLEIKLNKVNPGLSSTGAGVQFSTDAGGTWIATGYKWTLAALGVSYTQSDDSSGDTTQIHIQDRQALIHGTLDLSLGASATMGSHLAGGAATACVWMGGSSNATANINGIKIYTFGGAALSGTYDVIGYL